MRSLTDAEARVIGVLLAGNPGLERERLKVAAVPRSTYHAARRRAYAEGWVIDRYVPDPPAFGRSHGTFLLLRPFADRFAEVTEQLSAAPDNVVLWASTQLVLAVFLHRSETDHSGLLARVEKSRLASWAFPVPVDLSTPAVPVFFDFEGLWSHLADFRGTVAYPRGLGGTEDPLGDRDPGTAKEWGWAARQLVERPFVSLAQGRAGHLVGPFGLPWSQQKLLRSGRVGHRVFLQPGRPPPYQGRGADQVIFITGELRPSAQPPQLFMKLTRESRVFPFLFVAGTKRLLIGALGRPTNGATGSTSTADGRTPVMETLREHLEGIEVVQESAANIRFPVEHRYDRLIPGSGLSA